MSFRFGEYSLRRTSAKDAQLLARWIENDPFHRGRVTPDFFLNALPGEEVWAVEDEQERVVFYFKTQTACRVHIQFGNAITDADRKRNRDAMIDGLEWLQGQLAANGFRELLFDSENPLLIATAKRRLGFLGAPDDLRRMIPTLDPQRPHLEPRDPVPQAPTGEDA